MLTSLLSLLRRLGRSRAATSALIDDPTLACPLAECRAGLRATVVCVACPAHDAQRLRTLGVFEGASVGIVDTRSGILLDVRGSRLALDVAVAGAITVQPLRP